MVHDGSWGEGCGLVGAAAVEFEDAAEAVAALILVVALGVELLEGREVVVRVASLVWTLAAGVAEVGD